jgi:hypothetical protein
MPERCGNAATAITALRAAADSLAIDTATWTARDPGNLSREALKARESALKTIDRTIGDLPRLRRERAGCAHKARGRHS